MADDFRSRKVHNELVIALLTFSFIASLWLRDFSAIMMGVAALILALVLGVPLLLTGVLGGGDVKLFAVFAFALDPATAFWTFMYSILWGAAFGVVRAALQNQLLSLVKSTYRVTSRGRREPRELHKIPYTFALLLGWFTQLTLMRVGGFL
jgi:Flp pilus assembly protein protease CpaA